MLSGWFVSQALLVLLSTQVANIQCLPQIQLPSNADGRGDSTPGIATTRDPLLDCICVPYFNCVDGRVVNDTENTDLNTRIVKEDVCPGALDVCCGSADIISTSASTSTSTTSTPFVTPPPPPPPTTEQILVKNGTGPRSRQDCGYRNEEGNNFRVLGGNNEARFGEFPWMVLLVVKDYGRKGHGEKTIHYCGGSLIHPQVVLTAAHCAMYPLKPSSKLYARAGEWDVSNNLEVEPSQDIPVKSTIVKQGYSVDRTTITNDIALLILERPFQLSDHINIVCLPNDVQDSSTSNKCISTGWGKDTFGRSGKLSNILKKTELPIVPVDSCENQLRTTRLGKHFRLDQSALCAGGEVNNDVCSGDGGGPLVCPIENQPGRYKLTGIVSWGIGCGTGIPGVFTNVPIFKDWIDQQMASLNFDVDYNYNSRRF